MMGIIKLWQNELVKIRKQTANKVFIIITLVLAILVPLGMSVLNSETSNGSPSYLEETKENFLEWADECTDIEFSKYYYLAHAGSIDFFIKNEIDYDGWKSEEYRGDYETALQKKYICQNVIDGKINEQDFNDYFAWDFYYSFSEGREEYYDYGMKYFDGDMAILEDYYEETEIPQYASIDFAAELESTNAKIAEIEKDIVDATLFDYAKKQAELADLQVKSVKEKYKALEEESKEENSEITERDLAYAKAEVEGSEYIKSFYEAIKKDYSDNESWILDAINRIGFFASSRLMETIPVSREEFADSIAGNQYFGQPHYETYEEYVEAIEREQSKAREALITLQYAIDNNIEPTEISDNSSKYIVNFSLSVLATVIILVMTIITASTVANEYTNGTIRLLLIRPRNRTKIILSKFLALLTVALFLTVGGLVLTYLSTMIFNGVEDLFVPDLLYNSRVIEVSSVLFSFIRILLPLFSGAFLVSIAFMMAILTRRPMLSIIISMIINLFSSIIQMISVFIADTHAIMTYTVLPYLNLGSLVRTPFTGYSYNVMDLFSIIADGIDYSDYGIRLMTGVIVVAVHLIIVYTISFIAFKRQQIKN